MATVLVVSKDVQCFVSAEEIVKTHDQHATVVTAPSPCEALALLSGGLHPILVLCGLFPDCMHEDVPGCIALLRTSKVLQPPPHFILWSSPNDVKAHSHITDQAVAERAEIAAGWGLLKLWVEWFFHPERRLTC